MIAIRDFTSNRVLVTRESARTLGGQVDKAIQGHGRPLRLDFEGIQGLTPSFLDELISVVERAFQRANQTAFRIEILSPPTQFSAKFAAIGRGRDLAITESRDGSWLIERTDNQAPGRPSPTR